MISRAIGSFMIALFIVSIPILCALSYVFELSIFLKFLFTIFTTILLAILTRIIYTESEV